MRITHLDTDNPRNSISESNITDSVSATYSYDITFSCDLTGTAIEDNSDASGIITNTDPHYGPQLYIAIIIVTAKGTFSIDTEGNWAYILDNTNEDVQSLATNETTTDTFTIFTEGEKGTTTVILTVIGTNDQPVIELMEAI